MKSEKHTSFNVAAIIMTAFLCLSCLFCGPYNKSESLRTNIENLGIFGASRKKSVIGQDGCTPIRLGNIMMWTFGDTIIGSWKGNLTVNSTFEDTAVMKGMLSNSIAFTSLPDDSSILNLEFVFYKENGVVAQFIKPFPGENPAVWRFWAIDGIQINRTVYIYYIIVLIDKNIAKKDPVGLPIRVMGVGIAEWNQPAAWKPGDPVAFRRTEKIFFEGEPVFGDAVVRRGEFLYIIGHGPASNNRVPAFVTRVRVSSIKKRSGYEFLTADGHWTRKLKEASPIIDDVMGEPSLSYNEFMNAYIILYCSLDGKIKAVTFDSFDQIINKKTAVIYMPPSLPVLSSRPDLYYYSGKEILSTGKALYAIYINPAIYQPILLKIPYRSFQPGD